MDELLLKVVSSDSLKLYIFTLTLSNFKCFDIHDDPQSALSYTIITKRFKLSSLKHDIKHKNKLTFYS